MKRRFDSEKAKLHDEALKNSHTLYNLHDHVHDSRLSVYTLQDALKALNNKSRLQKKRTSGSASSYSKSGSKSRDSSQEFSTSIATISESPISESKSRTPDCSKLQFIPSNEIVLGNSIAGAHFHSVFKAAYASQEVCVKHFNSSLLTEASLSAFLCKLGNLAALSHPHIVRLYGICMKKDSIMLVSELCSGSLDDLLSSPNLISLLTPPHQYSLVLQVCHAMTYVHAKGIIHGRLKTRNIMFVRDFGQGNFDIHIKIGGFGSTHSVSQRITAEEVRTAQFFMAPEVLQGSDPAEASDVYAFGYILWCIFARERIPVASKSFGAAAGRPRPPKPSFPAPPLPPRHEASLEERSETFPLKMQVLLRRCLDSNPSKRPTFENLVHLIEHDIEAHGVGQNCWSSVFTRSTASTASSSTEAASSVTETGTFSVPNPMSTFHAHATV